MRHLHGADEAQGAGRQAWARTPALEPLLTVPAESLDQVRVVLDLRQAPKLIARGHGRGAQRRLPRASVQPVSMAIAEKVAAEKQARDHGLRVS